MVKKINYNGGHIYLEVHKTKKRFLAKEYTRTHFCYLLHDNVIIMSSCVHTQNNTFGIQVEIKNKQQLISFYCTFFIIISYMDIVVI